MKYYYCNATPHEIIHPAVEKRSLTGDRTGEVGFYALTAIPAGTIILTADALSLFELDGRDDLEGMRDWAEFLVGKLSLNTLSELYPRTLSQARTLPILGQNDQSERIVDALEAHSSTLLEDQCTKFIQESLLFHKLVANAFSYTEKYMCIYQTPSIFNHSPNSNIGTTTNGKRMVFHAKRAILEGEELTINYGNELYQ